MKIAFYVSNKSTRLIKFIEKVALNDNFHSIIDSIGFIYIDTTNNSNLKQITQKYNLQLIEKNLEQEKREEKGNIVSKELLENLNKENIAYLFVFGERILKGDLLEAYRNKIINFHPSILPAFSGFKAIDKALLYGSIIGGNTAHFIDDGVDSGPIIMQNIFSLAKFKDYDDILDNQVIMLIQIILWLFENRIILEGRKVWVRNADYSIGDFIPKIEISL